jgi:hypothetical protein
MKKISKQSGFAVVEGLLIFVIVGIIGFTGWYVWHSQKNADKSYDNSSNSSQTTASPGKKATTTNQKTSTSSTQKYLTIKEWGVRIPYSVNDALSYHLEAPNLINVASKNLADKYGSDCADYGAGSIGRLTPQDTFPWDNTTTAEQDASAHPSIYSHVGNYYYRFNHDQAYCISRSVHMPDVYSKGNPTIDAAVAANDAANDFTQSILSKIEAVQ